MKTAAQIVLDKCPLCGGRDARQWFEHQDQEFLCALQRCRSCGLTYLNPVPSPEAILERQDLDTYYDEHPVDRGALERLMEYLERFTEVGRLLEIGCNRGDLLVVARDRGWQVNGVEISGPAFERARERLGERVFHGDLGRSPFAREPYDLLVMWHVLEHVPEPRRFLREAREYLLPGGVVGIQVPGLGALDDLRARGEISQLVCQVHVNYFELHTLARTLEAAGFVIEEQTEETSTGFLTAVARRPPATRRRHRPRVDLSVCQITGAPEVSRRYRAERIDELLRDRGADVRLLEEQELYGWSRPAEQAEALVADRDLVILNRLAYSPEVEAILEAASKTETVVAWETDDLVFMPGIERWVDGVRSLAPSERALYTEGVERYWRAFSACDVFLGSTTFLAQVAKRLGKKAFVVPNTLSAAFVRGAAGRSSSPSRAPGSLVIGYGSGTSTHDRDFAEAAPALAAVLDRHPEVELILVGSLELDASLERHHDRVIRKEAIPWREWPGVLGSFDINLAPLEARNPYCRAKSAIKYLEAAYLGVPTVATDVDSYRQAIVDGETGLLASDTEQWEQALERLVGDEERRVAIGEAARADVDRRYLPEVAADELIGTLRTLLRVCRGDSDYEAYARSQVEREPFAELAWLVPAPFKGSGGHNDIFQVCRGLERRNLRSVVYADPGGRDDIGDGDRVHDYVAEHFVELDAEFRRGWKDFDAADVAFPTLWTSAYALNVNPVEAFPIYFVQDYEPFFYMRGSQEFVLAENTYRLGYSAATLGPWLARTLAACYGMDTSYFDFPVDRRYYFPAAGDVDGPPRLVFFAQPEKPRRAYHLGIEALEILTCRRPDVEIVFFGSDNVRQEQVPFPIIDRGILRDEELAQLYREATVGLVFSYTNPSLVPVSMVACGCPVVEADLPANRLTYGDEGGVWLVEPTPEAIAAALEEVVGDADLRASLVEAGQRFTGSLSFDRMAEQVEGAVLRGYLTGRVTEAREELDFYQGHGDQAAEELYGDRSVRQTLRCRLPVLTRLELKVATFGREVRGELAVTVRGQNGRELLRVREPVSDAVNWGWRSFDLGGLRLRDDDGDSRRAEDIVVEVAGVGTEAGSAPSVVYTGRQVFPDERLSLSGRDIRGCLAMKAYGLVGPAQAPPHAADSDGADFPMPAAVRSREARPSRLVPGRPEPQRSSGSESADDFTVTPPAPEWRPGEPVGLDQVVGGIARLRSLVRMQQQRLADVQRESVDLRQQLQAQQQEVAALRRLLNHYQRVHEAMAMQINMIRRIPFAQRAWRLIKRIKGLPSAGD